MSDEKENQIVIKWFGLHPWIAGISPMLCLIAFWRVCDQFLCQENWINRDNGILRSKPSLSKQWSQSIGDTVVTRASHSTFVIKYQFCCLVCKRMFSINQNYPTHQQKYETFADKPSKHKSVLRPKTPIGELLFVFAE